MSAFAASDDPDALDYSYMEPDPATTTPPIGPPSQSMSSDPEASHSRSRSNNPLLGDDNPLVSELEQEVLDEYSRLLRNVNQVSRPDQQPTLRTAERTHPYHKSSLQPETDLPCYMSSSPRRLVISPAPRPQ